MWIKCKNAELYSYVYEFADFKSWFACSLKCEFSSLETKISRNGRKYQAKNLKTFYHLWWYVYGSMYRSICIAK